MNLQQRINAFVKLGEFLGQFSSNGIEKRENVAHNDLFFDGFQHQMKLASEANGWFTYDNMFYAFTGWSKELTKPNIEKCHSDHPIFFGVRKLATDIKE